MPLSSTISAEEILNDLEENLPQGSYKFVPTAIHARRLSTGSNGDGSARTETLDDVRAQIESTWYRPLPKFQVQDKEFDQQTAYDMINNELQLDGKPQLNLASFVNTATTPLAEKLIAEQVTKNLADSDEYPALLSIHQRCITMLSHLWNRGENEDPVGTACTGSSEAIHLGGLAMKKRWQHKMKEAGKSTEKPNIIMGANAQVALEKFARYFDVEARILDMDPEYQYSFNPYKLKEHVDENTIGVFVIMGSTYTGHYQDVQLISSILDDIQKEKGWDIPIHIDGASGGFVLPFTLPEMEWDFRVPRVHSINTSGHKFGLTTAGCGWIIWRDRQYLPQDLLFVLKYLGGSEESFTLNFSRPGFPVIHQYYNFVTLGKNGFARLHGSSLANARTLSWFLEATGYFTVISDIHRLKDQTSQKLLDEEKSSSGGNGSATKRSMDPRDYKSGLPVVAWKFSDEFAKKYPELPQEAISTFLRVKGYIVPNYPLAEGCEDTEVLRIVVRASLDLDLLDKFMIDIVRVVRRLTASVESARGGDPVSIRKILAQAVAADGDETEHEQNWVKGTRSLHQTAC